jgi:hypothetical protein
MPPAYQQAEALENSLGLHHSRFRIPNPDRSSTCPPKISETKAEWAKLG